MLMGPPGPREPLDGYDSAVPGGYICGSRASATLRTGAMGKSWSGGVVVECRCLNAMMQATGSSCESVRISAPGVEPAVVTSWHATVETGMSRAAKRLAASACIASQVSTEASLG